MTRFFVYLCSALIVLTMLPHAAHAAEGTWASATQSRARLLTGVREGTHLQAALEIELTPSWHTYWKVPGDAGLPPELDWSKTPLVQTALIHWPAPTRLSEAGIVTFGHTDRLFLPLDITLTDAAAPLSNLDLNLQIMVCHDICLPEKFTLAAPVDNDTTTQKRIDLARQKLPASEHPRLAVDTVVASDNALAISVQSRDGFDGVDVIASAGDRVFTLTPNIALMASDITKAMVTLEKPADIKNLNEFLAGKTLEVLVTRGGESVLKTTKF